jgi:hypothetical protein
MPASAKFLLVFFLLLGQTISHLITGQSPEFFEGALYDKTTFDPVAFAQIRLKLIKLNIYSNSDGTFRLPTNSDLNSDSILISCFGYKKHSIAFHDLSYSEIKKIYLTPSVNGQNVKVSARTGEINSISILRRAIGKLSTGYPAGPFSYISYYRDYQKTDSNCINLNEAIIQTFDSGFIRGSMMNVYRILDFRKNPEFPRMNLIPDKTDPDFPGLNISDNLIPESVSYYEYGNELLTLTSQDPVRNFKVRSFPFVEIFSQNFIDNHNFSPASEDFSDNLRLFKITFNGKTATIGDSLLVSGAIYIQPDNYSIHKLEYSCYNNAVGIRLKKLFSINLEYGNDNTEDSLMHLKYISMSRLYKVFDSDDKSYFRLRDFVWDIISYINPTLILTFNNKVDPVTARIKENFLIMIGKKEIQIKNIQAMGENIYLRFKKEDYVKMTDTLEVYVRVLKDQYGNILNKRVPHEIYQYRELFVQEYTKPSFFPDIGIDKSSSSVRDSIPLWERKKKYWMNTPGNNKN